MPLRFISKQKPAEVFAQWDFESPFSDSELTIYSCLVLPFRMRTESTRLKRFAECVPILRNVLGSSVTVTVGGKSSGGDGRKDRRRRVREKPIFP